MNTPPQAAAVVGAGPILAAVARRIGLVATIDPRLTWDATRCRLSPGERILALLLNWLTEREPWYQGEDAFRLTDPALLLGAGITVDDLGDDALGRARDQFAQAGPAAVFSAVAARAYAVEALDRAGMHWDSTSRSLYGRYPTADGAHGVTPRPGHSKDPHPDWKQILFTCVVNRDGVPLMGRVEDGNRSDQRRNGEQIAHVGAAFSPAALQDLIYIADSALVTGPNLEALHAAGIAWLSRVPDPCGAAGTAKAAAGAAETWTARGRVAARPHAATYWAAEQRPRSGTGPTGSWFTGPRAWTSGRPGPSTGSWRGSSRRRTGRRPPWRTNRFNARRMRRPPPRPFGPPRPAGGRAPRPSGPSPAPRRGRAGAGPARTRRPQW